MTQAATNIEQSYRLIDCGIDNTTADMYIVGYHLHTIAEGIDIENWFSNKRNRDLIPSWSLSKLLTILPDTIELDGHEGDPKDKYNLLISPWGRGWRIEYIDYETEPEDIHVRIDDSSLIEATVKMIEELYGNGMMFDSIYRKLK